MEHEQRVTVALKIAYQYGQIDGAHHKAWVLDQMVRVLCGSEAEYNDWVRLYQEGEDGPETYEWDVGIPG